MRRRAKSERHGRRLTLSRAMAKLEAEAREERREIRIERAFRAFMDLLDAADEAKKQFKILLNGTAVTMERFRVMELLYREGRMPIAELAKRRRCNRQNMDAIVAGLVELGLLKRKLMTLQPGGARGGESAMVPVREGARPGRLVSLISLTRVGRDGIEWSRPWDAKMAREIMRGLKGGEQSQLSRLCRKLIAGGVEPEYHPGEETEEQAEEVTEEQAEQAAEAEEVEEVK